jgi:hypothetical protein
MAAQRDSDTDSESEYIQVPEVLKIIGSETGYAAKKNAKYLISLVEGTDEPPEPDTLLDIWRLEAPMYFVTTPPVKGIQLGHPSYMKRLVIDRTMRENANGLIPGNVVIPGDNPILKRLVAYCKRKRIPMQIDKPPVASGKSQ